MCALNCCVPSTTDEAAAGVTCNESMPIGAMTSTPTLASRLLPWYENRALTLAVPAPTPVRRPVNDSMTATVRSSTDHRQCCVTSNAEPSENVAVQWYCRSSPTSTDAEAGVTDSDASVGGGV